MRAALAVFAAAFALAACREPAPAAPPPPWAWRVSLGDVSARDQDGHVLAGERDGGERDGGESSPADPDAAARLHELVLNTDWSALADRAPEGHGPTLTVEIGRRRWTLDAGAAEPRLAEAAALLRSLGGVTAR